MKLIAPFSIDIKGIKLPHKISINQDIEIIIDNFSIEEKEWFLAIKNLKIKSDTEAIYTPTEKNFVIVDSGLNNEIIHSNYKIIISSTREVESSIGPMQQCLGNVSFISQILFGIALPTFKIIEPSSSFNNSLLNQGRKIQGYTKHDMDAASISEFEYLIARINQITGKEQNKIQMLKELSVMARNTAVSTFGGGFFVTIIESIFVPDYKKKTTKKFIERTSRYFKVSKTKMNDYYDKRSKLFHEGENQFDGTYLEKLEEMSNQAIREYIKSPQSFLKENLEPKKWGIFKIIQNFY